MWLFKVNNVLKNYLMKSFQDFFWSFVCLLYSISIPLNICCCYVDIDYSSKRKTEFHELMQKTTTRKESLSLVSGGGGVGKSHFIAAALELEAPSLRISTPCAKMPLHTTKNIQVTRNSVDGAKESTTFEVLTDEKYTRMMVESGTISTSSGTSLSLKKVFTSMKNKVRPPTLSEVDKHLCTIMCM